MALLYLLHLNESSFDTQTTAVVNSAPSGLVFQNLGIGTDPGGRFWFAGEGPFGQGLNTEGLDGARTCITSTTQVTLTGAFCFEGFASDFNDYGTDLVSFSVNGTDDALMRIRVEMHDGVAEGAYKLICYAQVEGPGTGFLAFETGDILPLAGVAGMPSGFHWALTRSAAGYLAMYANGARQALATTAIPGSLTGYIEPFGSRNRVNNDSNGGYQFVIGELRGTDGSEVYTGTTYTVPTERFSIPAFDAAAFDAAAFHVEEQEANEAVAAQTLDDLVQVATAKVVVSGQAQQTLDDLVQVATASVVNGARATQTLDDLSQVATAQVVVSARATQSLDDLLQASTGQIIVSVRATQTLDDLVQVATAQVVPLGSGAVAFQVLDDLSQVATAQVVVSGQAQQTLDDLSQIATGSIPVSARATQTLDDLVQIATGSVGDVPGYQATQVLDDLIQHAVGSVVVSARAQQTVQLVQTARGQVVVTARVIQTLDDLVQVATGSSDAAPLDPDAGIQYMLPGLLMTFELPAARMLYQLPDWNTTYTLPRSQ